MLLVAVLVFAVIFIGNSFSLSARIQVLSERVDEYRREVSAVRRDSATEAYVNDSIDRESELRHRWFDEMMDQLGYERAKPQPTGTRYVKKSPARRAS